MKTLHAWIISISLAMLALTACNDELQPLADMPQPIQPNNSESCFFVADDFNWEESVTRTSLTIEGNKAKFAWTPGDRVGILPDQGAQVYFEIPQTDAANDDELTDEERKKATFDGGAWALKPTSNYAAYYPFVKDFDLDRTKVPVNYVGQKQTGNNNPAHLGAYDYMGARPVTTNANGGGVTFDFDHVGALVLLRFTVPEAGTELKSVTLSADGATFTTQGTYDLNSTEGFSITATETSTTMTIGLDYITASDNEEVTLYFMCAPIDLLSKKVNISIAYGEGEETFEFETDGKNLQAAGGYLMEAKFPAIDLSEYEDGATVDITENSRIIGNGNEYNLMLNVAADAIVIFEVGTGGVKLNGLITVADGKTLTLLVEGNAEHTVKGGISLGNGSNVIIEGDRDQESNKLTVTATDGNAGIGANGGVTAGDITIRNARVDATGSSKEVSADSNMIIRADTSISGAAIGTSDGSMGDILIENSIIVAEGGYYENTSHAPAIGIGYVGSTMGNITLKDSQITAANNGDGLASVIGAGANHHVFDVVGTLGDIVITNTDLNLSMAIGTQNWYAAMIGSGIGFSNAYVNMGKIIFTDVTQAELDEMIASWLPSDFNEWGAYALGRGSNGCIYQYDAFGGVWVSDGNGGTVQIGDDGGYYCINDKFQ